MLRRIVILVSGNGSNAQAIIDACSAGHINAQVVAIISNNKDAFALERARKYNIDALSVSHKDYVDRVSFDKKLMQVINAYQPDLIVLAGFMRILTEAFVSEFKGRMLNIHPSLLPKYTGLNTHQRAIDSGDREHGSSVHFVTAELDGGPVVLQGKIPIFPTDTADVLAKRVATIEWKIYPRVVEWFCDGRLQLTGDDVILDTEPLPKGGVVYEQFNQQHS